MYSLESIPRKIQANKQILAYIYDYLTFLIYNLNFSLFAWGFCKQL